MIRNPTNYLLLILFVSLCACGGRNKRNMPALERSSIGDTVITHDSSIIVAESIKNNIEKSTKLAEMPDTAYLVNSTDKFLHVNDSVFIKEVFFPYMGLYYDNS